MPRSNASRFGAVALALIFVAACGGSASPSNFGAGLDGPRATAEIRALEHRMFERLNRDRAASGLPPLQYDERLADIGRAQSEDMRAHQFFAHESPLYGALDDRFDRAGYVAKVARENLAEATDVDTAEDGLLKSPHHHENIMANDVTRMGIGIVRGGVKDPQNLLFTQEFAAPARETTTDQVVTIVLGRIAAARKQSGLGPIAQIPMLMDLAHSLVADLTGDLGQASLDKIAQKAVDGISRGPNSGLKGVVVGATRCYDGEDYEVGPNLTDNGARGIGIAVRDGRDDRGRPAKEVLVLVGQ